jgi:hypothetical protein
LTAAERTEVEAALRALSEAFGNPHVPAGLGIRRLRANAFECRAGIRLRVLFFAEGEEVICYAVGNHDYLRRLLRSL